jgi:hypothetical protein
MPYIPADQEEARAIMLVTNYLVGEATPLGLFFVPISGMSHAVMRLYLPAGGFGLLERHMSDQDVRYDPHGHHPLTLRRHAANIWFSNETVEARPDRWVAEVFQQDSEDKVAQLLKELALEGFPEFTMLKRRGPIRFERTLADYGLGR